MVLLATAPLGVLAEGPAVELQTITGVVVDSRTGQPLSAAQITIEGTDRGGLTDGAGRFDIETGEAVGVQVTIVVQRLGYRTEIRQVQVGDPDVRIELEQSAIDLDAIVVTGTAGGEQRRAIGHAIGQLRVSDQIELTPVRDFSDMLNARVPGVMVHNFTGNVGTSSFLRIRGRSSFSLPGVPLVYVDGVRLNNSMFGYQMGYGHEYNPLDDLDPNEIDNVEVIKGPAAATLYGTEASAGVINITTRRGQPGAPPQLRVTMRQGAGWLMDAENRFPVNYWRDPGTGEVIAMNLVERERARGTPIFRTGHQQGFGANLTGGGADLGYSLSASMDDDQGATVDNWAQRYSGRARLTLQPHPTVDIDAGLGMTRSEARVQQDEGLWRMIMGSPAALDGPTRGFLAQPYDMYVESWHDTRRLNRAEASFTISHRPTGWLTHRLTAGREMSNEEGTNLRPFLTGEVAEFFSETEARGRKVIRRRDVEVLTFDYAATASTRLSENIGSSTSAGVQVFRRVFDLSQLSGQGFVGPGITAIAGSGDRFGSDDRIENTTVGFYLQEQLSWQDRFYLTGAVRVDNNSAFGEEMDFVTYPKVSASWVISEEPFWNIEAVNLLRLRAAFGMSGEQPDAFAAVRTFTPFVGTGDQPAVVPGQIGNPELSPERGVETEVGLEGSFFRDRLSAELTFYHSRVRDAILEREVPVSTGFYPASQLVNAGELENRGIEAMLSARILEHSTASWDLSVNVARNTSKVLNLGEGVESLDTGWVPNRHQIGYPVASFFMRHVVSADAGPDGQPINAMCDGGPGQTPVPCDEAPAVFVGKPDPHLTGSVTSTFTLPGGIQLFGMFDFQRGASMYDYMEHTRCLSLGFCEELVFPERFSPRHLASLAVADDWDGSEMVRSLDFVKLRELSLNYPLPSEWAQRMFRASRASITLAGRNLYTWTDYPGPDPEYAFATPQASGDRDSPWSATVTPPLSRFTFSVNVLF
jgi:outer membrane receptor protein involved in Fe transport